MRADRLLGLLMLLQRRGRMTARDLAAELEVSERTIYRDVSALRVAGVPVDTVRGAGGGVELYGAWRSDLTGLTAGEAAALFALSAAGPLADLGRSADLRRALSKLAAALPRDLHPVEDRVRTRLHIDPIPFHHGEGPPPLLRTLYRAVMDDRWVHLQLRRSFDTIVARRAAPLGLVAKAAEWYLVWSADGIRIVVDRVGAVAAARLGHTGAPRPPGFDLTTYWSEWSRNIEASRPRYSATVLAPQRFVPWLRHRLGSGITVAESNEQSVHVTIRFDSMEDARSRILGLGGAVEVVAPRALRLSVADAARHTAALYPE